jgi:hypothetical protein
MSLAHRHTVVVFVDGPAHGLVLADQEASTLLLQAVINSGSAADRSNPKTKDSLGCDVKVSDELPMFPSRILREDEIREAQVMAGISRKGGSTYKVESSDGKLYVLRYQGESPND